VQTQDRGETMKRQMQRRDKKGRIVESFRRIQVSKRPLPTQEERDAARASLRRMAGQTEDMAPEAPAEVAT
jgi:hypothetical protein